jgi:hypothetical protein
MKTSIPLKKPYTYLVSILAIFFLFISEIANSQISQSFNSTGANQTFTVPAGVTSITVNIWGAGGGGSQNNSGSGGSGAYVKGTLAVTPGQTIILVVGGGGVNTAAAGGFGGGGNAGGAGTGASGGGYSGIFTNAGVSQANALAIAGGGGGGGYYGSSTYGGAGGATTGSAGGNGNNGSTGGGGGSLSAGGIGGTSVANNNINGGSGSALTGGTGANSTYDGGGGGGGYYGGGGGFATRSNTYYSSGGGGGSSYLGSMTATVNIVGVFDNTGAAAQAPGSGVTGYIAGVGNGGSTTNTAGGDGLIIITYTPPACISPSAQATSLSFPTITSTSISGSFTAATGTPSGYLIVQSTNATLSSNPVNGTSYAVGASLGGGMVVQASAATTFTASSPTSNTKYYYFIFSYNSLCTGQPYYLTTAPLTNNAITCAGAPTINAASGVTSGGFTINWTAPSGGSAGTITYTISVSLTSGGANIAGFPVSGFTGLSYAVTGLNSNTKYYYRVTSSNGICGTASAISNTTTSFALCTTPTAPTALLLTPGVVSVVGSFTAPATAPTNYLVIRTTSSTAPTAPTSGTIYTAGSNALGGYIVSTGATTGFTDNGLSASTRYWYWVYSYNATSCTGGPLYSFTNLNGNSTTSAVCGTYTIYGVDNQGYIYPINTNTAALQTPLNYTPGVATNSNASNALGYNVSNSKFYYFSKITATGGGGTNYNTTFTSYDGVSTYNTLSTPFGTGAGQTNTESVLGTSTLDGNGFYTIDENALMWYYNVGSNTWTEVVTTKIQDNSGNNLTSKFANNLSGDFIEDGYGTLWLLLVNSANNTYGLYYLPSPPTTAVANVTVQQVIPYNTALPSTLPNNEFFTGAAFDNAGNMFISSQSQLYEIPIGATSPTLVGSFSGLINTGNTINDLGQCTYTSNPLPISWAFFNATPQNNEVNLDWGIAQASNVKGFYVERSGDSKNWDTLGFVPYINGSLSYTYKDASPLPGSNYYRINEIDLDGNSNYSVIRFIEFNNFSSISVWPNPAVNSIHVQYNGNGTNMTAQLFDELGRNISKSSISQGNNTINLGNIASGIYFLLVQENNKTVMYKKIIKRAN